MKYQSLAFKAIYNRIFLTFQNYFLLITRTQETDHFFVVDRTRLDNYFANSSLHVHGETFFKNYMDARKWIRKAEEVATGEVL